MGWLIGVVAYLVFVVWQAKVIGKREGTNISLRVVLLSSLLWPAYWFEEAENIIIFKADEDD